MARVEIRFAGFGGQGIILSGIMLGKAAAILAGKNAAQTQSFGTEVRGSASQCNVVIDDEAITCVRVVHPDVLACMSQEAYDKFVGDVREGGMVFYDTDLVKIKEVPGTIQVSIPATKTALEVLNRRVVANMVILGSLIEATKVLDVGMVKDCIKENVPKDTEEINLKAFDEGRELYRKAAGRL